MRRYRKYVCFLVIVVLIVGGCLFMKRRYSKTEKTTLSYQKQITRSQMTFFAHRGYSDFAPEESLRAEEMAAQKGFAGLNIDLWPTKKDSQGHFDFAVSHSDKLEVISDEKGILTDLTASQVTKIPLTKGNYPRYHEKDYVPLLGQMIDLANKYDLPMQLEMKGYFTKEQEDELYRRIQAFNNKVYVECIQRPQLVYMANLIRKNKASDRFETNYICYEKLANIDFCARHGITRVAIAYSDLNPEVVAYAKKKGVKVSAFSAVNTKDTKKIAYDLYQMGVRTYTVANRAWRSDYLSYLLFYKRYRS